jgi:hypothetical protein
MQRNCRVHRVLHTQVPRRRGDADTLLRGVQTETPPATEVVRKRLVRPSSSSVRLFRTLQRQKQSPQRWFSLLCWPGWCALTEESGALLVFTARIASFMYMEATQVQSFCSNGEKKS